MAETGTIETAELKGGYSLDELNELLDVMQKLIRVRDVILAVNREYIRSAGQSDDYRTEPAFKLQGSYRNMNRIAERVSPVMNDAELESLILSQYEQDSQTLTTGAEANMLKFKELTGALSEEETARWESIKRTFQQNVKLRGIDAGDKFGQVVAQMGLFSDGLSAIRDAVVGGVTELEAAGERSAADERLARAEWSSDVAEELGEFRAGLDAIQHTLATGVETLSEQSASAGGDEVRPLQATFAPEAMELLTRFIAELQMASAQTAARPQPAASAGPRAASEQPYKVEVINRVPRAFLSIIREQFKLMQSWMQPLIKTTQENSQGMQELQQQLEAAMRDYDHLVDKLKQTE